MPLHITHMPNWTTFDDETSAALRSRLAEPNIEQRPAHLAMEHILQRGETVVAVMPGGMLDQAALAVFRWNRIPVVAPPPATRSHTRPGGFLGLTDESDFDEEETQEKKSWWKRLWDE